MSRKLELNNMKVQFNNLGGRANDFGDVVIDVTFAIPDKMADELREEEYYISQWTPKDKNGNPDPNAEPINLLKGIISFRDKNGQLKPRGKRPEVLVVMEGDEDGVFFSESMLKSNFGGARPRLEILYADEIVINQAGKPRRDGQGYTSYINSIVLVCKKKSKYGINAARDDEDFDDED